MVTYLIPAEVFAVYFLHLGVPPNPALNTDADRRAFSPPTVAG